MPTQLTTDAELAESFGLDLKKFHRLRVKHDWPHVRLGHTTFVFTDTQVEQILRQMSAGTVKAPPAPGTRRRPQLTEASARRHSA